MMVTDIAHLQGLPEVPSGCTSPMRDTPDPPHRSPPHALAVGVVARGEFEASPSSSPEYAAENAAIPLVSSLPTPEASA